MNEVSFDESAVVTENSADTRSRLRNHVLSRTMRFSFSSRQVLDPVYVDALGHARRGRLQGIRRRVDVHLAVEHRGGEPFGVEPDFVGLAAVDLHAVHQEIVVIEESPVGERAGKTDVENVDEVGVEVDVAVHLSRELGDGEAVLHPRYAVGADDLARQRGVALAVVKVGRGFGDHGPAGKPAR